MDKVKLVSSKIESCRNCMFSGKSDQGIICKRRIHTIEKDGKLVGMFPLVNDIDWCWEYKKSEK